MTPLRGLLVGTGGIARQAHLPAFLEGKGIPERLRIVGTVDPCAGERPIDDIPHFAGLGDAGRLGPIDFIDICTPSATHLALTLQGLAAGYHVLCEKPVAVRMEEVEQLRAARRPGQVIMACHQYRHNPAWTALREWLDAGAIGRWHLAELSVHRLAADGGRGPERDLPWRARRKDARGGILLDHGTHLIYQVLDVAGLPSQVQCWTGRLRHGDYDVEDSAHLLLEYPDRAVLLFLTWGDHRRETRIRFVGDRGSVEWAGGTLRLENRAGILTRDFTAELAKSGYYRWFAQLFHQFADRIARQDGADALDDIARVTRILEAAYQSDAAGCRIPL